MKLILASLLILGCGSKSPDKEVKSEPKTVAAETPAKPADGWSERTGKGFVVRAPRAPQESDGELEMLTGPRMPTRFYTKYGDPKVPAAYQVLVSDLSKYKDKIEDSMGMTKLMMAPLKQFPGAEVDATTEVTAGTTRGMEIAFTVSNLPKTSPLKLRMRVFASNRHVYQIQAMYPVANQAAASEADKFIESFAFAN
ncbi:MAG: hypothetical protein ABI867_41195 [Kofleriaceae bacterium]